MNLHDSNPSLGGLSEMEQRARSIEITNRRSLALMIIFGTLIWFIFGT